MCYLKDELYERVRTDPTIFDFLHSGWLDGIWFWDLDNPENEWMSDKFWQLFGYDPDEMPHRADAWQDIIHPDDLVIATENFKAHCADPSHPYDQIVRYRHRMGGWITVRCRGMALRDETGRAIRMLGAHTDLTGMKAIETALRDANGRLRDSTEELIRAKEKAEQASRLKSSFLATMSHEVRTPLNGVLGIAAALDQTDLDDNQRALLDILTQSGKILLSVLNDVLDISKIEAGEMTITKSDFDLRKLCYDSIGLYKAAADEKGLCLDLEFDPAAETQLTGCPHRISQVLNNLLANAIRFTETGSVTVRVGTTIESDGRCRADFEIIDTGVGLSDENKDAVMEPFVQVGAGGYISVGGTGLGLSIARGICKVLGGRIGIADTPGGGCTVRFCIMTDVARKSGAAEKPARDRARELLGSLPRGLRLLVAEDNMINQQVLTALLGAADIEMDFAGNGQIAVEKFAADTYDAILMDIQMPVMDGVTAGRKVREIEATRPRGTRTPLIALTAHVLAEEEAMFSEAGFDAHVAKPIDLIALMTTLHELLAAGDPPVPLRLEA